MIVECFPLKRCVNMRGHEIKSSDLRVGLVLLKSLRDPYLYLTCKNVEIDHIEDYRLWGPQRCSLTIIDICYYRFEFETEEEAEKFCGIYNAIIEVGENKFGVETLEETFSSSFEVLESLSLLVHDHEESNNYEVIEGNTSYRDVESFATDSTNSDDDSDRDFII